MTANIFPNPDRNIEFSRKKKSVQGARMSNGNAFSGADDLTLLELVRNGNQSAMAEIFDRHGRAVYSVAVHILKDDGLAEDVMQEIFFQVWQTSDSFVHTLGSLRTWLMAVARNRSIDVLRRSRRTDPLEKVILIAQGNLVSEAEQKVMIERVRKALKTLPEEQQKAMNLAFFEELSHVEIAQRTGAPVGTIKTRIRLALIALRRALAA
jgi:RNA polymerase sigma-70 factor (ECF subfamily)